MDIRKNGGGLGAAGNSMMKRSSLVGGQDAVHPFLGLQNRQYYTCFMNSILQCLIATPHLMPALCSLKQKPLLNKKS